MKTTLGGWEHIWVGDVELENGFLTGRLSNDPAQGGYSLGQNVRVPISDISDWSYRNADGVIQGHYTTRVLLERIDPDEAAGIKAYFGWD